MLKPTEHALAFMVRSRRKRKTWHSVMLLDNANALDPMTMVIDDETLCPILREAGNDNWRCSLRNGNVHMEFKDRVVMTKFKLVFRNDFKHWFKMVLTVGEK